MKNRGKLKKVLGLLECNCFLGGLVFYAPVALLVRTERSITISQFFVLEAILSFTVFIGEIPAGWLTDKIGYKISLVIASIVLFCARIVLLFAKSFPMFLMEAILEGISSCFVSGTQEAYMYSFWHKEDYSVNSGKICNYGTAGFILSTISYALLMHLYGLTGLIAATCIANAISIVVVSMLPKEPKSYVSSKPIHTLHKMWNDVKLMLMTSSIVYIAVNSLFSVSTLIVNFFYIIKITQAGLPKETMTIVIIGYSLISFLCPLIIKHFKHEHYKFTITIYLAGGAAFFAGLFFCNGILSVIMMILGPLVLNVPTFLFSELLNENVDKRNMDCTRATALSVYNIGCNALGQHRTEQDVTRSGKIKV